jgi:hypothetical protein
VVVVADFLWLLAFALLLVVTAAVTLGLMGACTGELPVGVLAVTTTAGG